MIILTREHSISIEHLIFTDIYERQLYNVIYVEETCLKVDAPQKIVQCEGIHVTFSANEEKFVLLQLTS